MISDDGRIIKAINVANPDGDPQVRSVVIEELQVLRPGTVVRSLNIVRAEGQVDKLLIVSDDILQTIPLQRCTSSKITNCRCVHQFNVLIIFCVMLLLKYLVLLATTIIIYFWEWDLAMINIYLHTMIKTYKQPMNK